MNDHQYGFRKHRPTGDMVAYIAHICSRAIEQHEELRAIAFDNSNAFDRVWHADLLAKLPSYDVSDRFCTWLSSFLRDRSLQVGVDGSLSHKFTINADVPQESVLSRTLLLLNIDDLLDKIKNPIYSIADSATPKT